MNPQDDEFEELITPKPMGACLESGVLSDDGERQHLLTLGSASDTDAPVVWKEKTKIMVFSNFMTCSSLVAGTYYYTALLPAFESDDKLDWTEATSTHMNIAAQAAETLGLFLAGPLADYFLASTLLSFHAAIASVVMICVALCSRPPIILAITCMVMFTKGMMWPSVGNVIAANIPPNQQDTSFLVACLASRSGDTLYAIFFGILMGSYNWQWRHAVTALVAVLIPIYVILFGYVFPKDLLQPHGGEPSVGGWCLKWKRMLSDPDGWLAFFTLAGTYGCWALAPYVSVLFVDVYHVTPGEAAGGTAFMTMGMVAGLLWGSLVASIGGVTVGRTMNVIQGVAGILALQTLATWDDATFNQALYLQGLVGFGFVVPAYLPYLAYSAASPPAERAFRLASLDGAGSILCIILMSVYGQIRQKETGRDAARKLYSYTAVGLSVGVISMAILYSRLGKKAAEARRTASSH